MGYYAQLTHYLRNIICIIGHNANVNMGIKYRIRYTKINLWKLYNLPTIYSVLLMIYYKS